MNTTTLDAFWEGFTTSTIGFLSANQSFFGYIFMVVLIVAIAGMTYIALTSYFRKK